VRAAAAITWVAKYDEVPPMTLQALMARDTMSWDVRGLVNSLMHQKSTMGEKFGTGTRMKVLDDYIESNIALGQGSGLRQAGDRSRVRRGREQAAARHAGSRLMKNTTALHPVRDGALAYRRLCRAGDNIGTECVRAGHSWWFCRNFGFFWWVFS
jgi:hypothetical protein